MEKWYEEHRRLYGADPLVRKFLPKPRRFPVVRVTDMAHQHVLDLEQAYARAYAAVTEEEKDFAFANLIQRRKELYEHIEAAEEQTPWPRTVTLRFY